MDDTTLFYILGIALAVSALVASFLGLKVSGFPGKAFPMVVVWFLALSLGSAFFAVRHAEHENEKHKVEYENAGENIEKAQTTEPFEEAEEENPSGEAEPEAEEEGEMEGEGEMGATGSADAGAAVFTAAGCGGCHTFGAAGSGGVTGPNLDEVITADDSRESIEEMIVDPGAEVVPGYSEGIMPSTYGESLSSEELADLVEFIYVHSPAEA